MALNRFLNACLANDPVGAKVIEQAARQSPPPQNGPVLPSSNREMHQAESIYSSQVSSGGSFTSRFSYQSTKSLGSLYSRLSVNSRSSRRGRRQHPYSRRPRSPKEGSLRRQSPCSRRNRSPDEDSLRRVESPSTKSTARYWFTRGDDVHTKEKLPYFCTFCGMEFRDRYVWNRHEESIHVPQKLWICNPQDGYSSLPKICPYDSTEFPSHSHLTEHNHFQCVGKPESERTFFRKDNFMQHLCQTHKVTDTKPIQETIQNWEMKVQRLPYGDPSLHCGFCGQRESTWERRVDHVAEHFVKQSLEWKDWWQQRKDNRLCTVDCSQESSLSL